MKKILFFGFIFQAFQLLAQFSGPVGTKGTTAMFKDSSAFVAWANGCKVVRGPQEITGPKDTLTKVGIDLFGTLKAGENGVVSLGDGGQAILTFVKPITNGLGFDFAVFENSFNDTFLELAFVEVSSDGINYIRFPATSNTQTLTQIGPFDNLNEASKLNNLAGKYRGGYGTPFDLEELKDKAGLDINRITHIKIIDVIGTLNPLYASYDQNKNPINDPYPTAFVSGGFDLDAVGVIHQSEIIGINKFIVQQNTINVYPNPTQDYITIHSAKNSTFNAVITDSKGNQLIETSDSTISLNGLNNGLYFLNVNLDGIIVSKKIIKN